MKLRDNLLKSRLLWIGSLIILILLIKIFSRNVDLVENAYSTGIYPFVASLFRFLLGWLPFSMGDLLYLLVIFWLVRKVWRFSEKLFKRKLNRKWFVKVFFQLITISMSVYIVFNIFWGINYNRRQASEKLQLGNVKKDTTELKIIEELLVKKVNQSKQALITQKADYPSNKELFKRAVACYKEAEKLYSFLNYKFPAVKSSMFGWFGNYLGFTGYYNPFSGEAQLNTKVPKFILPYTTSHEIAHQLGYAKEQEANFVGYLAATNSTDTLFHYSTYLDLFVYANRQLFFLDSVAAKGFTQQLIPEVKADIAEWRAFLIKHKNPLEPIVRWAYGNYLRANQQPEGMTSYDEVIADLIAFYKKYGRI